MRRECWSRGSPIAFLMVFVAVPCFGWGAQGHQIVAMIASRDLNDRARVAVRELLGSQTLVDVSTWADEITRDRDFEWTKPLHYINVPRNATRVERGRDCPHDVCVVAAIENYTMTLRNRSAPRRQRTEALKFLIHFVGDIHQPLHVSYADDRGGNNVTLRWFGESDWNLHSVWDDGLVKQCLGRDRTTVIRRIRRRLSKEQFKLWRNSLEPEAWANESLAITRRLYGELPARGEIGREYCRQNSGAVEQRLAAAGVRLAALLNGVFL